MYLGVEKYWGVFLEKNYWDQLSQFKNPPLLIHLVTLDCL